MKFINATNNTIYLSEIDKYVPFLGDQEQTISADDIKKSPFFQNLCIQGKIIITGDCSERMEENLNKIQMGLTIPAPPTPIEISIKGQFYNNTGFAKANRNLARSLLRKGCKVSIQPINQEIDGLNELEAQQLDVLTKSPSEDAIVIESSIPSLTDPAPARYSILYTTIEAASIPASFVDICNLYNEVWTPSVFCKNILVSGGVKSPVFIIPNAVDANLYSVKAKPASFTPKLKDFVFLSVFGWNYRKGYDALLKAYLKAFKGQDNVSLLLVSRYNLDVSGKCKIEEEIREMISQYGGADPAHVARCGRSILEFEMPKLYRGCHAFVLPSRGEGFGLPYLEASLCGIPVIATNHSGHTMFLNQNNSSLVEIDNICPIKDKMNVHYWDNEQFADLTSESFITSLAETMMLVYKNHAAAVQKNEMLRQEILRSYTVDAVGAKARERLDEIWKTL